MGTSQNGGRTLVVGLGATGLSVARHLVARAMPVRVIDSRPEPPGLNALRESCPGIEVRLASLETRWLEGVGRLVLSPGLSVELPLVVAARARGIPVVSDIELFARASDAPVAAVTGSNGKSTVATLTRYLLEGMGLDAAAGGNLGPPALDLIDEHPDVYVLEISSFQMETTESLRPQAAALLNISADHLDRHGSLERYTALKQKLLDAAHAGVYNQDDPLVGTIGRAHPNGIPFSTLTAPPQGYGVIVREGVRWLARRGEALLPASELRIRGRHNEGNALAALALAECIAHRPLGAADTLSSFPGLAHRCEWIAERRGVVYINDSKGTNVGATAAALSGLNGPFVLIAGGQSKGASFAPLAQIARGKVLAAVLIGEAAGDIGQALADVCPAVPAVDMRDAVARAAALARVGMTVLLSPACASFDMFADYADRGRQFAAAVRELGP